MAWSINMSPAIGSGSPIIQPASGGVIAAAVASIITLAGSGGATFDFYIAPGGSDSNLGTLASPWSINAINTKQSTYAGKRVGIIGDQGSYDVSAMMYASGTTHSPVLNINGGTAGSPTYVASCNSSGVYQRGLATITANGNGFFGGGNSNTSFVIGQANDGPNPAHNWGNWTLDGIVVTGFSLWAVCMGNLDGSGGTMPNVIVQNNELTGGSAQNATSSAESGVNLAPIVAYCISNSLITNNYLHDNFGGPSSDGLASNHFSGMYLWGLPTNVGPTANNTCSFNTLINSGNIHSKEGRQYNWQVYNNHVDMTNKTPAGGGSQNTSCIYGFNSDQGAGTLSVIHHNLCIGNGGHIMLTTDTGQAGWDTPVQVFNNTGVLSSNQASGTMGILAWETASGLAPISGWNNLLYDNGHSLSSNYGYIMANTDGLASWDYNTYGGNSGNFFMTVAPGVSTTNSFTARNFAGWQTATGADAHSDNSSGNPFAGGGAGPTPYKLNATGQAYVPKPGTTPFRGCWDGNQIQIGCSFAPQ